MMTQDMYNNEKNQIILYMIFKTLTISYLCKCQCDYMEKGLITKQFSLHTKTCNIHANFTYKKIMKTGLKNMDLRSSLCFT